MVVKELIATKYLANIIVALGLIRSITPLHYLNDTKIVERRMMFSVMFVWFIFYKNTLNLSLVEKGLNLIPSFLKKVTE